MNSSHINLMYIVFTSMILLEDSFISWYLYLTHDDMLDTKNRATKTHQQTKVYHMLQQALIYAVKPTEKCLLQYQILQTVWKCLWLHTKGRW